MVEAWREIRNLVNHGASIEQRKAEFLRLTERTQSLARAETDYLTSQRMMMTPQQAMQNLVMAGRVFRAATDANLNRKSLEDEGVAHYIPVDVEDVVDSTVALVQLALKSALRGMGVDPDAQGRTFIGQVSQDVAGAMKEQGWARSESIGDLMDRRTKNAHRQASAGLRSMVGAPAIDLMESNEPLPGEVATSG